MLTLIQYIMPLCGYYKFEITLKKCIHDQFNSGNFSLIKVTLILAILKISYGCDLFALLRMDSYTVSKAVIKHCVIVLHPEWRAVGVFSVS